MSKNQKLKSSRSNDSDESPRSENQMTIGEDTTKIGQEADDLSLLRGGEFVDAISKLENLMTQGRRTFLLGAGCSKCAGLPLTNELTQMALASDKLSVPTKTILADIQNGFKNGQGSNVEDYLSELIDLLAIADRRVSKGVSDSSIRVGEHDYKAETLRTASEEIKGAIVNVINKPTSLNTHQNFIRAVHRTLRPGKEATGAAVTYLILNYDTLIEDALALSRLPYADGLEGGVTGWWNTTVFDRAGLAAKVLKLHGSIDWCSLENDPFPRRIGKHIQTQVSKDRNILIWPASTKYQETQLDPFAELIQRARNAISSLQGSQSVLFICGYSFGDSHINAEIDRALKNSAGQLTIVVFTDQDAPDFQLKSWQENTVFGKQILIFGKKGFFHGNTHIVSKTDLPWWKFENITRLLSGER